MDSTLKAQPSNAIIFVPGFVPTWEQNSGWTLLDDFLQLLDTDREFAEPTSAGTAQGYRIRTADACCDVFAASWDDRLDRLSAKPVMVRALRALSLAFSGAWRSAKELFGPSPAFASQTVFGFVALLAFVSLPFIGFFSLHKLWFVALTIFFASTSVAIGDITDVIDAYNRYLLDAPEALRNRLRNRVVRIINQVCDAAYNSVTIVGHSFGAIIAMDAIPHCSPCTATLVTIGASFSYILDLESSKVTALIESCEKSGSVAKWLDITSTDDPVASGIGVINRGGNVEERCVTLRHSIWDYITLEVHRAYFTNADVRGTMRELLVSQV